MTAKGTSDDQRKGNEERYDISLPWSWRTESWRSKSRSG